MDTCGSSHLCKADDGRGDASAYIPCFRLTGGDKSKLGVLIDNGNDVWKVSMSLIRTEFLIKVLLIVGLDVRT